MDSEEHCVKKTSSCGCIKSLDVEPNNQIPKSVNNTITGDISENVTPCCDVFGMFNISISDESTNNENVKCGEGYIFYDSMDDDNKKAMDIMTTDGPDAAIKYMMTNSDGSTRSYAEIRALYG